MLGGESEHCSDDFHDATTDRPADVRFKPKVAGSHHFRKHCRQPTRLNREQFMAPTVDRRTVDLSAYPDLVVIYLGMQVRTLRGLITVFRRGQQIDKAGAGQPEGLLNFENNIIFRLFPLCVGMRWYWKDFESMEHWARSEPHRDWWQKFLRNSGGTGFWHETYFMRGGMEAVYDDVTHPFGFLTFASSRPARGSMFSARGRLGVPGEAPRGPEGVSEADLY
jgi:fumigallin biosynthesis monooxygenase-like protein